MKTNIIVPNKKFKTWLPWENRTSANDPRYRPWRCALNVKLNEEGDTDQVIYYVRAGNPQAACVMAERYWSQWEKKDIGNQDKKYPDVLELGFAECIDENDWQNSWDDAVRYELQFRAVEDADEPGYPMLFTVLGKTNV